MSVYITKINSELSKACKEGDYHYVDDLLTLNSAYIDNITEYDEYDEYDYGNYSYIFSENDCEDKYELIAYKFLGINCNDYYYDDNYHNFVDGYYEYEDGNTPLILASEGGYYEIVELLLLKGAKIHHKNNHGYSSIMLAAEKGHYEIFELLTSYGANILDYSYTAPMPIILASAYGHIEIVELLISKDVSVNNDDTDGFTSLILASANGHVEIIELLLLNGAYINKSKYNGSRGRNAISSACRNGHVEAVKLLLLNGANIYDKNRYGETCLMEAFNKGRIEVVELLQKWPLSMLMIVLQELFVYNILDCEFFSDFYEYFYE
jgi:hypothetical protein